MMQRSGSRERVRKRQAVVVTTDPDRGAQGPEERLEVWRGAEQKGSYEQGMALALPSSFQDTSQVELPVGQSPYYEQQPPTMHGTWNDLSGTNSFDMEATEAAPLKASIFQEQSEETQLPDRFSGKKSDVLAELCGKLLGECGAWLLQKVLEVLPLRSKFKGKDTCRSLFPLPTSRTVLGEAFPILNEVEVNWLLCVCMGLNSMWGGNVFSDTPLRGCHRLCLEYLVQQVQRFCKVEARVEQFDWEDFHKVKSIDYKGEEVKVARKFAWKHISPALPAEIGKVALEDVCSLGCKHYVQNFESYLKPRDQWKLVKPPRVMVDDLDWPEVCRGLVESGVCTILGETELHHVHGVPLLNGMFGVTKDDFTADGVEIYRLIMNLIPLNEICQPLSGDVATLPAWSSMTPFFLQPSENLLVSSEDVKCFFYVMSVPASWSKFLGFNKPVPSSVLPEHLRDSSECFYLASQVLPMGFLNSVSLAQHVHRNLTRYSSLRLDPDDHDQGAPERELRKDRQFPAASSMWRIYLDNYDLLEKVESITAMNLKGTAAAGALALRQEYEEWGVPRNIKKSVERSLKCEVQGATVDGLEGMAYPRESKVAKYFALALSLVEKVTVTQKECQVVCGGLVYFSMFRRPLLGSLNAIWSHIESYNTSQWVRTTLPLDCKAEILRFLSLLPLATMDFRLPIHPQVTCSDASTSGGGICASVGTTLLGEVVAAGGLRGDFPEQAGDLAILVVGLFDGLGALRVAVEVLGIPVLGYVSVEKQDAGRRVVESHFPGVEVFHDVCDFSDQDIQQLSVKYSQAALVLLGAGPPCQGVSGLNADRRGALKDSRSSLFAQVPRIRGSFKKHFAWCPVYSLMESVASMDTVDRQVMSAGFGCEPLWCDASDVSWCHRPRLYWCDWEIIEMEGYSFEWYGDLRCLRLDAAQQLDQVIRAGWLKVEPFKAFPTFTTSRPRALPGRKPAGIQPM